MKPTLLSLFCGMGGSALGFKRAGFTGVGAIDSDAAACRDYEYLTGWPATVGDLGEMSPDDLLEACTGRPDVVFTSPPCKSFSACLPLSKAKTERYQGLSSLATRGIWLVLEAWEEPPPLIVMENVPRIRSRGRAWLDQIQALLYSYGYACRETIHDAGELGGLAQHRKRFLLVARHMDQVPEFLYEPPKRSVRGIGEVLDKLPVPLPGSDAGGPMHRLPRMSAMNWLRLALIPAGGDWRDLPESVGLPSRAARQNGGYGVNDWEQASHTVVARADVHATWSSTADPRLSERGDPSTDTKARHKGKLGVEDWNRPAHTVIASAAPQLGRSAVVADPRLADRGDPSTDPGARYRGSLGVEDWEKPAHTVIAAAAPQRVGAAVIADPRVTCKRREGSLGVKGWDTPATTVIGAQRCHNHPSQVADPRLDHEPRKGSYGVTGWATPTHCIRGYSQPQNGRGSVADPRGLPVVDGPGLDLDSNRPCYLVIQSADGTWHRPLTTLELAALQGFPTEVDGKPLQLDGRSHKAWRQRIGNAVPAPSAEAIARECAKTLEASREGTLLMSSGAVWVRPWTSEARI